MNPTDPTLKARRHMVDSQLRARGIDDDAILQAFTRIPRHHFLPDPPPGDPYGDHPLPIGEEQTISQPFIVAYMLQTLKLRPGERVLEIGAGCGYQTALLASLGLQVCALEIRPRLARTAAQHLAALDINDVDLRVGDANAGWPAPRLFDAIIAAAAADSIPPALLTHLAPEGRLILPVGDTHQELILATRRDGVVSQQRLASVRFVRLQNGSFEQNGSTRTAWTQRETAPGRSISRRPRRSRS